MSQQRSGAMSGIISGAVWAGLMALASFAIVEVNYTGAISYYTRLYNQNSSQLGGMTPAQYINYNLEFNTAILFIVGLVAGAMIGFLFVWLSPRFLPNQSYFVKGVAIAGFFWLVYELVLVGFLDAYQMLTSLGISLFSGFLLAYLYNSYYAPPNIPSSPSNEELDPKGMGP